MAWRPHPKHSRTDPTSPSGWATCDRSGFVGQSRDLVNQYDWRGLKLMPTNVRVLPQYLDKPQRQLGTIILSPDPLPLQNARPEQYPIDEVWPRLLEGGQPRYLENSSCAREMEYNTYFQTGNF